MPLKYNYFNLDPFYTAQSQLKVLVKVSRENNLNTYIGLLQFIMDFIYLFFARYFLPVLSISQ